MSITPFTSASGGFTNVSSFPDIPPNSAAMRAQMEVPSAELATYINSTLLNGNGTINADAAYAGSMLAGGWTLITQILTYATTDAPIFTATTSADLTPFISVPMKIMLTNTTVKYFIVTAITSSTITLYGGTDYTLTNAAISGVYYGTGKPFGFPLDPNKWTIVGIDATSESVSSPATTYKQAGSLQLSVPIGAWELSLKGTAAVSLTTSADVGCYVALSSNSTGVSDASLHEMLYFNATSTNGPRQLFNPVFLKSDIVPLTTKTLFYVVMAGFSSTPASLTMRGDYSATYIKAKCAYL